MNKKSETEKVAANKPISRRKATEDGRNHKENGQKQKGRMEQEDEKEQDDDESPKRGLVIALILLAVIIIIILLLLKGCSKDVDGSNLPLMPDYEESADGEDSDGTSEGDSYSSRLNLAVMDDYTVSKKSPSFTVAYPDQNHYDIEISIQDDSGKELYRTKRVRPGTLVALPGYDFLKKGKNQVDAVIAVYDPDSWELISEATTMKITVTKK